MRQLMSAALEAAAAAPALRAWPLRWAANPVPPGSSLIAPGSCSDDSWPRTCRYAEDVALPLDPGARAGVLATR